MPTPGGVYPVLAQIMKGGQIITEFSKNYIEVNQLPKGKYSLKLKKSDEYSDMKLSYKLIISYRYPEMNVFRLFLDGLKTFWPPSLV